MVLRLHILLGMIATASPGLHKVFISVFAALDTEDEKPLTPTGALPTRRRAGTFPPRGKLRGGPPTMRKQRKAVGGENCQPLGPPLWRQMSEAEHTILIHSLR